MSDSPSPPPAPDYAAAAKQTAQGNAEQALISQYGSMVNQATPYGTVKYTSQEVGKTKEGNPLNQWTQTVSLSPEQQAIYNKNMAINNQLTDLSQQGLGYVSTAMSKPLTQNIGLKTSAGDPELLRQDVTNALYKANTQYLDPQFQQGQAALENKLANQGITQGSEAYNNAMLNFNNQKQQAYDSARNQAISGGIQGAQGMFGMGLSNAQLNNQAATQNLTQEQALRQDPINMLNAVRTGSQMQTAQMPQVGVSQPAGLQAVAGPDMLGAVTAQGQYNQNAYNARMANSGNMMSGAMGMLGQIGGAALPLIFSDRRLKTQIKRIGTHAKGIGLYTWRYIWGLPSVGVMADEVEQVMPEAVVTMPNGFKSVNYAMLNGEN